MLVLSPLGWELGCAGRSTSHAERGHEAAGAAWSTAGTGDVNVGGASIAGAGAQGGGSAGLGQSGSAATMMAMHSLDVCAEIEAQSYRRVFALVFAVDRSAAMAPGWGDASAALSAFFRDPSVQDVAVSLRFFPDDRPVAGCDATSCSEDACATPLVPLAEVDPSPGDAQEERLVDALATTTITPEAAPQVAAYQGAVAIARAADSDRERVAIVLVTASLSSTCGRDLAGVIADTLTQTGIQTYVVAPAGAPDFDALDALADAGGSGKALRFGPPEQSNPLFTVLPLTDASFSCDVSIADRPAGRLLDFYQAWMTVTIDGGAPFEVPRVMSAADCGSAVGFYYDDNSNPEVVSFCPALCEELTQNRDAAVKVSFPCLARLE